MTNLQMKLFNPNLDPSKLKKISLHTDGSCYPTNPGTGGWGAILVFNGTEKVISGGELESTNNRMEIMAILEGLKALKESCHVTVHSDSQLALNLLSKKWKASANKELVAGMLEESERHYIETHWVKGHNGDYYNERCDTIALESARRFHKKKLQKK